MKYAKQSDLRFKVSIPLDVNELQKVNDFLKSTGRKAGPWLRILILQAIEQEKALSSSLSQLDVDFIEKMKRERLRLERLVRDVEKALAGE